MFCRNCGKEVDPKAEVCLNCGVKPLKEKKFCNNCGAETTANQDICVKCGIKLGSAGSSNSGEKSKLVAGLLAIFLGWAGIHKFYLGYKSPGLIMLLVSIFGGIITLGIASFVIEIIGLIEGIVYLTKSDDDFEDIYINNQKKWF